MKIITCILSFSSILLFANSCSRESLDNSNSIFGLSHENIELAVGENQIINVIGLSTFDFSIDDKVANATKLRGSAINIRGISSGSTILSVSNMDNEIKECRVKILHSSNEEENDKINSILKDNTIRLELNDYKFSVANIGILHSIENIENGIIATFASLDEDNYFKVHLIKNNKKWDNAIIYTNMLQEDVNKVSLSILGEEIDRLWMSLLINEVTKAILVIEI